MTHNTKHDKIPGYVHPTEIIYNNKDSSYMTLNTNKKREGYKSNTSGGDVYSTYNMSTDIIDHCPTCKEYRSCKQCVHKQGDVCTCDQNNEYMCKNNHHWYKDENDFIQFGKGF
jgi:hypothetical protein